MAADPSPRVSPDDPRSGGEPAGPRFERYVTRLRDGRRLTLYSQPAKVPSASTVRDDG